MIDLTRGLNIHRLSLCDLELSFPLIKISQSFLFFWKVARIWTEWFSDCKCIMVLKTFYQIQVGRIIFERWNDLKKSRKSFIRFIKLILSQKNEAEWWREILIFVPWFCKVFVRIFCFVVKVTLLFVLYYLSKKDKSNSCIANCCDILSEGEIWMTLGLL